MSLPIEQSTSVSGPPGTIASRPVQEGERLDAMDLVRGVAIFGILVVNMQFFAMPFIRAVFPADAAEWSLREAWAYYVVKVFFEFKFVSTFSLLFGAGLVMQFTRAKAAAGGFAVRYFRRIILLALVGLSHALLLWYGDILFIYACVGSVLFFFRTLSARMLITIAIILIGFSIIVNVCLMALNQLTERTAETTNAAADDEEDLTSSDGLPNPENDAPEATAIAEITPATPRGFDAIEAAGLDFSSPQWTDAETLAYRDGPFADATVFRAVSYAMTLVFTALGFGWHILAMFLIGAALMKLGFFNRENRWLQGRVTIAGLTIGLILEVLNGWLIWLSPTDHDGFDLLAAMAHGLGAPTLCLGYVGALSWIANAGVGRMLHAPFRAVGRMALTTYLMSTVVVTFLMYHWGLGWFGAVDRFEQIMIALCVYAGLVVLSFTWLSLFRVGPMEWLWRTVTYARPQPLFRSPT